MREFFDNGLKKYSRSVGIQFGRLFKWTGLGILMGVIMGLVGFAFLFCIGQATGLRTQNEWLIFLLPLGGILIVALYHLFKNDGDQGTNVVLTALQSKDSVPLRIAPLIFIGTVITHLFGGSAGREGAAIQLGGSIGNGVSRLIKMDADDKNIMTMCGMSAAFSALFGTPLAAAVFSMEVVSVGVMQYSALVPCIVSAFVSKGLVSLFGVGIDNYQMPGLPSFGIESALKIGLLAVLCAGVSVLFCIMLTQSERLYKKLFTNAYLRAAVGGGIIILLTLAVGNTDYNGLGTDVIRSAIEGDALPYAFALKMVFTALTIGAGFKGGEIIPSIFIGATFGCTFGQLLGISPTLCAAVGVGAVFCGVTNSPITSLLICFELFGFSAMPFFAIAVAISYMLSGYFGLYRSQRFIYSKYKTSYLKKD